MRIFICHLQSTLDSYNLNLTITLWNALLLKIYHFLIKHQELIERTNKNTKLCFRTYYMNKIFSCSWPSHHKNWTCLKVKKIYIHNCGKLVAFCIRKMLLLTLQFCKAACTLHQYSQLCHLLPGKYLLQFVL